MQKLLALLVFIAFIKPLKAQNSFSFNCRKDTVINCTTPCITLQTTLPNIHASTSTYTADEMSARNCFRSYEDPAAPGSSANLTIDDRYSPVINITFPFSFFGSTYNKLVASTNGFLSFDISKTATFSHYGILRNGNVLSATSGTPEDLPSQLYDGAVIMGPYHDLDPNNSITTQQIKYDVVGTAPYRKWILSYYNVPLYTTACLNLNTNTHQIVLYETLGIVEIFIFDKDICLNWNDGRAMIGMQDINKTSAVMAPLRQATSTPWGSKGMDESWRFIPSSGQSLFKRVELYSLSGNFITSGNTTLGNNNLINVNFNNVCPPDNGDTYVVKSFYKDPNSANEIIGTDTIHVSRQENITTDITSAACLPGSNGVITVTNPVGAQYEYSINGITWQSSNTFNVPQGTYTISVRTVGSNCISTKTFTVDLAPLTAGATVKPTQCSGPPSGAIIVDAQNAKAPYSYSLNGGPFQSSNTFTGLAAGNYTVIVQDASGCSLTVLVMVPTVGPIINANVTNAVCGGSIAGSIKLAAQGGIAPFTYSLNGGPFQNSNFFNNLSPGKYDIIVKDSTACSSSITLTVGTDVSLTADFIKTIPTCYGGANGSITLNASLGKPPYQYGINSNPYQNGNTFNNLTAGNYTFHIKDSVGCIKDTSIILEQPNLFKISIITTSSSTCKIADGGILVKANGGTTPYLYSSDTGKTYQSNNIFNVFADKYLIKSKDANGCIAQDTTTVFSLDNSIKIDLGPDKTVCSGTPILLSSYATRPIKFYSWTPSLGLNDSTSAAPIATVSDTTTYILNAKSDVCQGADTININVLRKPIANAGLDTTICYNTFAVLNGTATNLSGSVSYLWIPSTDVVSPNSPITVVRPTTARSHTYRLQVSDNYGCNFKVYDDVKVFMNEPIQAFAGNDTIAAMGYPIQLSGTGGTEYLWSPANVLNNAVAQNPIAILNNDTRFYLTVKDNLGCVGNSTVFVKVYAGSTFYIPNAFTPNGDGLNDVFRATAPGIQKTDYFRIYNRSGKIIYQSNDATKGWDGKYAGIPQPAAVYVWIIKGVDASGKTILLKGTVTLIR